MFGMKVLRESEYTRLREDVTRMSRELEDLGWINLSYDAGQQSEAIIGNFKKMIKACRTLYFNNPLAAHWIHLTTAFTIGEGIAKPKAKDKRVQEIIDEFWDNADNQASFTSFEAQQKLCNKLQYEGNLFPVFFEDELGALRVRFLNTEEVDDIIKDPEDRLRTMFYKVGSMTRSYDFSSGSYSHSIMKHVYYPDVSLSGDNPEEISAAHKVPLNVLMDGRILQIKINCDINDKYGVPELYRGMDWIRAHKNMMEDMATLSKALSTYAWKKKVKGGAAQVASIAANMQTKMNLTNIRNSAGQTQVENDGVNLESIDIKTGGMDVVVKGSRESKLMVCAASGIFEHYYGDPSTGNLATSKSMELPMVKKFSNNQTLWKSIFLGAIKYQIERKIASGMLPGTVTPDPKTGRTVVKTDVDLTIDVMFPSIIEEDLKAYAEAMNAAQDGDLVAGETAARLFLTAANVSDINSEIELIKKQKEEKEAKAAEIAASGLPPEGQPIPGANKPVPDTNPQITESSIDNMRARLDMRHQRKVNYTLQQMNAYRKQLRGHFKSLIDQARKEGKVHQVRDKFTFHIPNYHDMTVRFADAMQESADKYFPIAIQIGEKYMQSMLKQVKPGFSAAESLYEANGKARGILQKRLQWNQTYLNESFQDALVTEMDKAARDIYSSEDLALAALSEAVTKFEPRIEQYVGAFWTTEEEAVKEAGRGSGVMVNFIGPDDEHNCEGCEEGIRGNPWKIEEAPIPGEQDCLGSCRHALQVIVEDKK